MSNLDLFNLDLVKVAQEARAEFQAYSDAWYEMQEMKKMASDIREYYEVIFSSAYDVMKDEWSSSYERGMELDAYIKGYFGSLKWRAA